MKKPALLLLLPILFIATGRSMEPDKKSGPSLPVAWSRNATIYEVNVRQFTPEGTFKSLEAELPRLQKMGVGILWLMPIHPTGVKNRKGSLGSYYSVKDYYDINPEFGTLHDFRKLVGKCHELGMKVIIDWVANHTACDNPLILKYPDWYTRDSLGNIISPVPDWTDVADLDFSKPDVRQYMEEAMTYWIKETDIDGFRCDVAGMVPIGFWNSTIPRLRKIKPLFMLAEDENPSMHDTAFDATYAWGMHHLMNDIAKGKKRADRIDSAYRSDTTAYSKDAFRMLFTSNHDENSWNGTEFERLGEGARTFAVFTFTFPGIPMVYSGQEAAMDKRLRFFDKDTIPWGNFTLEPFYRTLMMLKKTNDLIASGAGGGRMIKLATGKEKETYAFLRIKGERKLMVVLNFSNIDQAILLRGNSMNGRYREVFTGETREWKEGDGEVLKPWQYLVYESY